MVTPVILHCGALANQYNVITQSKLTSWKESDDIKYLLDELF